jgi:2-desacetyl-2-hydroxyethyl bacteriochlorophyllide A dehydrogenase
MQALVWQGGQDTSVIEVPRPQPRPGWAVVDVAYCGICGTDLHICAGEHPRAKPGTVLGHEVVGVVAADTPGVAEGAKVLVNPLLSCGRCRMCHGGTSHACEQLRLIGLDRDGGAAAQVLVPVDGLVPLGAGADLRRQAFAEPLAVAVRAVRRARLQLGESVLIAGAGPIGLAVAACARASGARSVVVAEPLDGRRAIARSLGFETAVSLDDAAAADVVLDAAGHPSVAAALAAAAVGGGRIVRVGVYGRPAAVDLQATTFKELTVVGTRVYSRADVDAAVAMIDAGVVDPDPFITDTVALAEAHRALASLAAGEGVKVLLAARP